MNKKSTLSRRKAIPPTPLSWVKKREGTKRLTLDISADLHSRLKMSAAEEGKTMLEFVVALLEDKLK